MRRNVGKNGYNIRLWWANSIAKDRYDSMVGSGRGVVEFCRESLCGTADEATVSQ